GAAYRFETSLPQQQVRIYGEEVKFNFPGDATVFYPQEDSIFSHNERKYVPQRLKEIDPAFIATMPAVVDAGEGAKLAIAESDGVALGQALAIAGHFLDQAGKSRVGLVELQQYLRRGFQGRN